MDVESLAFRVQSLPQQLYDLILLEVFTPDSNFPMNSTNAPYDEIVVSPIQNIILVSE
jgi:hypothetical protein